MIKWRIKIFIISLILFSGSLIPVSAEIAQNTGASNRLAYRYHLYQETLKKGLNYREFRVLRRVIQCESSWQHYDEDGDILRGIVNPQDIGLFQIHLPFWEETANLLGYDLYDPYDNLDFGIWLYLNNGLKSWSASQKCWSK